MINKPNKITATLKVVATGEFYDDEASEETLRYCVEQDLEDAGFDVDVAMLKEQEAVEPVLDSFLHKRCPSCRALLNGKFCHECGQAVKWDD